MDLLLDNDGETSNEATPATRQQILSKQQLNSSRAKVFAVRSLTRAISERAVQCREMKS
jgi:hypothetical protein